MYRIREKGITVPVLPGIMPVTSAKQMKRICDLSGTNLPERFPRDPGPLRDDPDAMKQAGIIYATDQIIDLIANGINHIHIYSMNKPEVAEAIMSNLICDYKGIEIRENGYKDEGSRSLLGIWKACGR